MFIGIDIGGTNTKVAALDGGGRLRRFWKFETLAQRGKKDFLSRLCGFLKSESRRGNFKLRAVGVGIAGDVDSRAAVVRYSPNLDGWKNFAIGSGLRRALRVPVCVDNDANMAAWGAYRSELKSGPKNVLVVTLGTGVGGGLILNGRLYHGARGSAGEIGHTKVEFGGELCSCGERGCLEAYVGAPRLLAYAGRLGADFGDTKALSEAARRGNKIALEVLKRAGEVLGIGLSNAVYLLNPEWILLTGGVAGAGPALFKPMRRALFHQPFEGPFRKLRLRVCRIPHVGVLGAALCAKDRSA